MDHVLVGVSELSEKLSVNPSWIYSRTRLKGEGQIPHIRVGKYVRFKIDDVMTWLEKEGGAA